MYYLYILKCKDSTLYTGITTDLERRIREHMSQTGARYTKGRGPVKVLHFESFPNRSSASKREVEIKKLSRAKKLALIKATK
jgi:putative endonuclease